MKVKKVSTYIHTFKTGVKNIGAVPISTDPIEVVIIEIVTDEGIKGYCTIAQLTSADVFVKYIEDYIAPIIIGQNPLYVEHIYQKLALLAYKHLVGSSFFRAVGCIDIALWDILGKLLNKPIAYLLGVNKDRVPAYVSTAEWKSPEELAENALMYTEMGFKAFKVRGGRPNKEDDIKVVEEIRKVAGDTLEITVDANQSYNRQQAFWLARAFSDYNIRSLEEPLVFDDVEGYYELSKKSLVPISGGEKLFSLAQWRNMLSRNALDIMQPWPSRCGGITGTKKVCSLAEAFSRDIEPHSDLPIAESIQISCSIPNCSYIMWSLAMKPVREQLFENSIEPENGYFKLPTCPGIGYKIKPEYLSKL